MKKFPIFILLAFLFLSCSQSATKPNDDNRNYKQDMRLFVQNISSYAKGLKPNFYIIPQNGHNLITVSGEQDTVLAIEYINAIDGLGREDLFYGYNSDDVETPQNETGEMCYFLDLAKQNNKKILVTDYCYTHSKMDLSYQKNNQKGYISFAANHRELDNIPDYPDKPFNENTNIIENIESAQNFLYLLNNSKNYSSKQDFISTVSQTNYDLLIMDLFFDDKIFTAEEIEQLKSKQNGGKRLLICYMSIGEAEDYRYYWQNSWSNNPPEWLLDENPDWEGNYKVKYWQKEWQDIIFGNDESYLKKIIDAGFDGVYLDIIDAYEYFE